ncbi:MAG: trypsin-like peptidase domain-containing protein, partial [Bacteroidetes bacterium]|nr:trypsin-like peptidase domain-containing protein [Bacteroidota bacterium]
MEKFDINKLIEEDKIEENIINKPFRFAKAFDVNINLKKEGLLEILPNNDKLWRLIIKSPGAYSLNLTFGKYVLPVGAELFIYNKSKTHKLGAFTEENNKQSEMLAIQPIEGDEIIIEYSEPSEITNPGKLIISRVGHDYKGIIKKLNSYDGRFGQSQWCNVDINCQAGDDWQTEKWSVCRILINNTYLCSGSLINNTSNNYTAYFLTANHCINTAYEATNTVFVFNYESPSCDGSDGYVSQSISGSTLRAHWSTSDFSLVELSSMPPISYYPVWNGWDRRTINPSAPMTYIHHPAGDVRKISIDSDPVYIEGHFWCVDNWDTGTTQGGSSGSPLYNSDKRVVGQDSYSDCIDCGPCDADKGSCYGKFSSSWNGGGTSASRLRNWLDPTSKGLTVLDKIRRQYISGPFLVCTSNSTFTLYNRPSGTTVSWTPSSNLSYVSGQGTNSYTVKAASSSRFGWGWVEATIDCDCGDVTFRKDLWVGKFQATFVTGTAAVCPDELYTYTALVPGGHSSSYSYSWTYPSGWYNNSQWDNNILLQTPQYNMTYGTVRVAITNACGTAGPSGITVYPGYCGGYYMAFPNPGSSYVDIDINPKMSTSMEEIYNNDISLRVYNKMGIVILNSNVESLPYR